MKHIFFVNRFFYPDQSATSQILSDLVFNIKENIDSEIHIIASRNTYQNDKKLMPYELIKGVNVHRVWVSRFGRAHLIGRALDYFSFYISTFFKLLQLVKQGDIVVAKTDPPVISYIAYSVCKLKKAHLINWLQDLFPEVAAKLGMLSENGAVFNLIKKLKDKTLINARMNVVIGKKMGERIYAVGVPEKNITVISNWNINKNTDFIEKAENPLIKKWGLQDKFVIGYSGNFGRAHEYDSIRQLVKEFSSKNNIVFLFIGSGKYYDELKHFASVEKINNVLFKPYQPLEVLNQSLSVADLNLISLRPELEGLIVPSKFFGLASIGAGILFIGDCNGELGDLITDYKCGYCCAPQNIDMLIETIESIINSPEELIEYRRNLKQMYIAHYQPQNAYSNWVKMIKSCER